MHNLFKYVKRMDHFCTAQPNMLALTTTVQRMKNTNIYKQFYSHYTSQPALAGTSS